MEHKIVRNHRIAFCIVVIFIEVLLITISIKLLAGGIDVDTDDSPMIGLSVISLLRTLSIVVWCFITIMKLKHEIKTKYVWLKDQYMKNLVAIGVSFCISNVAWIFLDVMTIFLDQNKKQAT